MIDIRAERALQFALVASLILHALALFAVPGFGTPLRAPALPPLTAVLRSAPPAPEPQAPAAAPAKEPVQEAVREAAPDAARPVAGRPRERSAKGAAVSPSPQPTAAAPPRLTAPADASSPAIAAPAAEPAPAAVASAAPRASASPRAEPADPDALHGYKVQLAAYATKYKRYPSLALERGWEGIAEVRLTIGANGRIPEVAVAVSSGHELLDREAVEMVRKAAPITEITPPLRNRVFSVNLPIVFNIERKGGQT